MVSNSKLDQPMSCFDFVAARANIVRVVVGGCAWFDLFVAQEHIGSEKVNLKTWSTREVSPDRTRSGFGFSLVSLVQNGVLAFRRAKMIVGAQDTYVAVSMMPWVPGVMDGVTCDVN
jgi:hypothetical protein